MYAQDYDEKMMTANNSVGRWPQILAPYVKMRAFVYCPSADYGTPVTGTTTYQDAIADPAGNGGNNDYYYGLCPSYGYNYVYLSPTSTCPQGFGTNDAACQVTPSTGASSVASPNGIGFGGSGIVLSRIEEPARTVAMADSIAAPTSGASAGKVMWGYSPSDRRTCEPRCRPRRPPQTLTGVSRRATWKR